MELPKQSACIGSETPNVLIADLKNWGGIQRPLEGRLYENPVMAAGGQQMNEIAIVPLGSAVRQSLGEHGRDIFQR
jgi:hypothetical protein